ncbi:L,D-transpeptidase family protein [Rhizobium sp. KVB221]|uniref:L,D-transpeptidase family protein n=1 Tax=Rhizobium setariae TaxID=2801340 RepID=A0A936YKL8_9HYPH|nr:L,D-transpeptidase family protein [Rhizobium setariae]MBL0371313.1 L,D-transpeptidase family protein [Rhizobium setariae]
MSDNDSHSSFSRRGFLRSAALFGAAAVAGPALTQEIGIDDIINAPRRGNWDDQFDAKASRTAAAVLSNNPIFGPGAAANLQQAIYDYESIVANGGWPQVNTTVKLKIGVIDPAVRQLRERLMVSGDLAKSAGLSNSYDSLVEEAVKRFQARHGLPLDGVLGQYTLKAMNIPADVRLAQLRTNLTRVEAITTDLGQRYVMVNIPAAYIEAVENNRVVQRHTAIVGRISRPSPILDSKIYEVIINPYWTSPRSIVEKDIMPLMRKDPSYLEKNSIRLIDGKGNEVDPKTIDWNGTAPNLMFRQDPGKINAMASTKINFHNTHAVYMHDTPQQGLFNKLVRFESSGCVRVQNVRDLTTWLLRDTPGWSRQQMEAAIRTGKNNPVKLAVEVPVYFKYITAWSAKDRVVQFRDDIYQMDGAQELALQTGLNQEPAVAN